MLLFFGLEVLEHRLEAPVPPAVRAHSTLDHLTERWTEGGGAVAGNVNVAHASYDRSILVRFQVVVEVELDPQEEPTVVRCCACGLGGSVTVRYRTEVFDP
jgi:hypothetical protein